MKDLIAEIRVVINIASMISAASFIAAFFNGAWVSGSIIGLLFGYIAIRLTTEIKKARVSKK